MQNSIRRAICGALLLSLGYGCSANADDDAEARWQETEEENVSSVGSTLRKGMPGAVNGQADFCDGSTTCGVGEGDCDSNIQCSAGLICGRDNGPKFGLTVGSDVCAPASCFNKRNDGDETSVDCGGSCGSVCAAPACASLPMGSQYKCVGGPCTCTVGQGDCNENTDCATGLICGRDNGPKFGFAVGSDVCVPASCSNRVMDGTETQIDCGGSCGTLGSCASGPAPTCGNGVVNGPALTSIVYTWLSTGCSGPLPVKFSINGSLALTADSDAGQCTCTPGISAATVTDAAILALVTGGTNQFGVDANNPSLAFAWAKVTLNFVGGSATTLVLDDVAPTGDAEANQANLCEADYAGSRAPATQTLNGVAGEQCDDGNVIAGDGCNADCTL